MTSDFTGRVVVPTRSCEKARDGGGASGEYQTLLDFYEDWGPQPDPQQAFREMILKSRRGMELVRDAHGRL